MKFWDVLWHVFIRLILGLLFFVLGFVSNEISDTLRANWYHHAFGVVGSIISTYAVIYLIGYFIILIGKQFIE